MEHRDVAFDVMQQVGEVPEATRKFALAFTTALMFGFTLYRANVMLSCDGFNGRQRLQMIRKGLPWFLGARNFNAMKKEYLDWFKKTFIPINIL
jgi:predicted metal-dependent hydrolase